MTFLTLTLLLFLKLKRKINAYLYMKNVIKMKNLFLNLPLVRQSNLNTPYFIIFIFSLNRVYLF